MHEVQNLREKKREFYETNLRQKINKPKKLWKTLKSMGLPCKAVTASNICLKNKNQGLTNLTFLCTDFCARKMVCMHVCAWKIIFS